MNFLMIKMSLEIIKIGKVNGGRMMFFCRNCHWLFCSVWFQNWIQDEAFNSVVGFFVSVVVEFSDFFAPAFSLLFSSSAFCNFTQVSPRALAK